MAVQQSSEEPGIDCEPQMIKMIAKNWINHLHKDDPNKIILISAMADATKVSTVGGFSQEEGIHIIQIIVLMQIIMIRKS